MNIEAFVITNGRSTFDYAVRSLEEQTTTIKITVIRDMKWVDAVNKCVALCESPYFVRVDDDMFLHKKCVAYMASRIKHKNRKRVCAYSYKLWEDWQHKIAGSVKVYNVNLVKKMGGFTVNKFGKIDKKFNAAAKKKRLRIVKDPSVVGIHATGSWEDQQKYRLLWSKNNARTTLVRPASYLKAQKTYKKSLDEQYALVNRLTKRNKRLKTRFFRFMKG